MHCRALRGRMKAGHFRLAVVGVRNGAAAIDKDDRDGPILCHILVSAPSIHFPLFLSPGETFLRDSHNFPFHFSRRRRKKRELLSENPGAVISFSPSLVALRQGLIPTEDIRRPVGGSRPASVPRRIPFGRQLISFRKPPTDRDLPFTIPRSNGFGDAIETGRGAGDRRQIYRLRHRGRPLSAR